MATSTHQTGRQVYVPIQGFVASIDGVDESFETDRTTVSEAWLERHENLRHLFRPIRVRYDVEEASAAPGTRRAR